MHQWIGAPHQTEFAHELPGECMGCLAAGVELGPSHEQVNEVEERGKPFAVTRLHTRVSAAPASALFRRRPSSNSWLALVSFMVRKAISLSRMKRSRVSLTTETDWLRCPSQVS